MSRIAVYPGTFDPPTLGHADIIARARRLCDRLVVGVTTNAAKSPMFSLDARLALVRATAGDDVAVVAFDGLIVDFARAQGATMLVRGLRSGGDFEYEQQMAGMNRALADEVETVFLAAAPALQPVSSTLVREIARHGGDVARFVHPAVTRAMADMLRGGGDGR